MNTIAPKEPSNHLFETEFVSSFFRAPSLSSDFNDTYLLGETFPYIEDPIFQLSRIESFHQCHATAPFSYHINSFAYYMLLHTNSGSGLIRYGNKQLSLEKDTLLFFDCRKSFSLEIVSPSWNFDIYFLSGSIFPVFKEKLATLNEVFPLAGEDQLLLCLQILSHYSRPYHNRNSLLDFKYLNDLFLYLIHAFVESKKDDAKLPPYLAYMKKCFDSSYSKSFSLLEFEDQLQISRYRLCREFSKEFGDSPIQYLNKRRIEAAKNLLISTDLPIHEIASMVGIENANHFINIFKKYTKNTPYSYRQQFLNYSE